MPAPEATKVSDLAQAFYVLAEWDPDNIPAASQKTWELLARFALLHASPANGFHPEVPSDCDMLFTDRTGWAWLRVHNAHGERTDHWESEPVPTDVLVTELGPLHPAKLPPSDEVLDPAAAPAPTYIVSQDLFEALDLALNQAALTLAAVRDKSGNYLDRKLGKRAGEHAVKAGEALTQLRALRDTTEEENTA